MDGVTVREARPSDGEALARAWTDGGRYYLHLEPTLFQVPEDEGLAADFTQRLERLAERRAVFVAELDGQVVGWASAFLEPPVERPASQLQRDLGSVRAHVNAVMVEKPHRGRGVGTALMRQVEAWAVAQGAELVSVDAYAGASEVVAFYEGLGYERRSIKLAKRLG